MIASHLRLEREEDSKSPLVLEFSYCPAFVRPRVQNYCTYAHACTTERARPAARCSTITCYYCFPPNFKFKTSKSAGGRSPLLARVTVSAMPLVRKRQREDGEKTVNFMSSLCHYQSIEGLPSLFQKGRYRVGPLHFEIM